VLGMNLSKPKMDDHTGTLGTPAAAL